MSNLENITSTLIPNITERMILIGAILCLLSITVVCFRLLTKKMTLREAGRYLLYTLGIGILIIASCIGINFIFHFDIDFNSYKYSVPVGYIASLLIFTLLANILGKSNRNKGEHNP